MRFPAHFAILAALFGMIAGALPASAAPDQPPVSVSVEMGWGNYFRPGRWNPLFVTTTSTEPREVSLEVYAPTDQRYAVNIIQGFTASQVAQTRALYVPFSYALDQSSITLRDRNTNRTLDRFLLQDYTTTSRNAAQPVNPGQILIGVTGNANTQQLLESQLFRVNGNTGVLAGYMSPTYMPSVAMGFDALDMLILNGANLSRLDADQQRAIVQWVRSGGLLVYWPGNDPLPESGPLLDILPCKLGANRNYNVDTKTLDKLGLTDRFSKLPGRAVSAIADDVKTTRIFGDSELVAYRRWAGFGKVLLIPADVSMLIFNEQEKGNAFWNNTLRGIVHLPTNDNNSNNNNYYDNMEDPRQMRATRQALDWMGGIPGAGEFGFSYLAFALIAMMLVVGPIDWFVLKWMGRQPWTWVTTTGWIALVTLGAISIGHVLKSGDLHFRTVTLLDEASGERAAQTTLAAIYAPRTTEYDVKFDPQTWWRPATEGGYFHSQGMPTEIDCHQDYRGSRPLPMLINVWNLRFLQGTNYAPTGGIIFAKLTQHGDKLEGSITNQASYALTDVVIRTKAGPLRLQGRIEPGGTMPVDGVPSTRDHSFATTLPSANNNYRYYNDELPSTRPALPIGGDLSVRRTDRIQQMLDERTDIACVYANFEAKPEDMKLEEPDVHEMHTGMVRAIVPIR